MSIRKTKKRLKKEIAENEHELDQAIGKPATYLNIFLAFSLGYHIDQLKQELQQLKRKKI